MGKRRRGNKTSPKAVKRAEKQREAFQLRKQGFTVAQIGNRIGVHASTVCDWIRKGLEDEVKSSREEMAAVSFAQLDELQEANSAKALAGDQAAAAIVLRCIAEKNKMLGIREGGGGQTINIGISSQGKADAGREIRIVTVPSPGAGEPADPIPISQDGSEPFTAKVYQYPRAIEHIPPANDILQANPLPKPATRRYDAPPPPHKVYSDSFKAREVPEGEPRTELDVKLEPAPPKKRKAWSRQVLAGQYGDATGGGLKWGPARWNGPLRPKRRDDDPA